MKRSAFVLTIGGGALFAVAGRASRAQEINLLATPSPQPPPVWQTPMPAGWTLSRTCENPANLPVDFPVSQRFRILDGGALSLEHLRGYGVWLTFFATWCAPCHAEMPEVVRQAQRYHDAGLRVIAVNVNEDETKVRAFRSRYKIDFPVALDPSIVFNAWHLRVLPSAMFVKPDGRFSCIRRGMLQPAAMQGEIARILPPPSATPGAESAR